MEVLAALALTDEEFAEHMMVKDGVVPPFYSAYITAVHEIIERNARLEFECLWRENEEQPGRTRSVLSDELSYAILALNIHLQESNTLWENRELRQLILADAIPKLLQEQVGGLEVLMKRLPESYLRALFGSYLASRFVYKHGINPGQFAFYEFMDAYSARLRGCN
jgi:glutamate dehydrogenase